VCFLEVQPTRQKSSRPKKRDEVRKVSMTVTPRWLSVMGYDNNKYLL